MSSLLFDKCVQRVVVEWNRADNRKKLDTLIVDPIISYLLLRLQPLFISLAITFSLIMLLSMVFLYLVIKS